MFQCPAGHREGRGDAPPASAPGNRAFPESRGFGGSYLDFLRGYFLYFSDLTGYTGAFTPGHLWFILYLFALSLAASEALPAIGGKNPFFYFVLLLLGFLAMQDRRFEAAILRLRHPAILILPFSLALYTFLALRPGLGPFRSSRLSFPTAVYALVRNLNLWLVVNLLLGFAAPGKGRASPFLAWASSTPPSWPGASRRPWPSTSSS